MRELAASPAWARDFPVPIREWHVHEIPEYYDMLAGHAARLDLWSSEYLHVLDSVAAVAEWYRGTGLRPFLDALPDAARREQFLADYTARLHEAFAPRRDGRVLFPFRRVFFVAYR
jgi:trans-aconitate 2-methyltransferase